MLIPGLSCRWQSDSQQEFGFHPAFGIGYWVSFAAKCSISDFWSFYRTPLVQGKGGGRDGGEERRERERNTLCTFVWLCLQYLTETPRGGEVILAHSLRSGPWLLGPMWLSRTPWCWELVVEDSCLCHSRSWSREWQEPGSKLKLQRSVSSGLLLPAKPHLLKGQPLEITPAVMKKACVC